MMNSDDDDDDSVQEDQPRSMETPGNLSLSTYALGMERRKSEIRTLGGLLLILGSGAAHSALALTAVVIEGMSGRDQVEGFNLPLLVGNILQCSNGIAAMIVGLHTCLEAPINETAHLFAKILMVIGNLAPITIIFSIYQIITGTRQDPSAGIFIPVELEPTRFDNNFVASCGVVALIAVCVTLLGGLNLLTSNLCAFIGDQGTTRNRLFYVLRYGYFCLLVSLGGWSQLLLGIYCLSRFGKGPYDNAIHVTVYTIFLPLLTCIVGFVQTIVGVFGLIRVSGKSRTAHSKDRRFEYASLISWLITMLFQIVVQPSYAKGDAYDAEGATFASVYLGFFIIPVWLDYRIRNTPKHVSPEYYGISPDAEPKLDCFVKVFIFLTTGRLLRKEERDIDKTDSDSTASGLSNDSSSKRAVL